MASWKKTSGPARAGCPPRVHRSESYAPTTTNHACPVPRTTVSAVADVPAMRDAIAGQADPTHGCTHPKTSSNT